MSQTHCDLVDPDHHSRPGHQALGRGHVRTPTSELSGVKLHDCGAWHLVHQRVGQDREELQPRLGGGTSGGR